MTVKKDHQLDSQYDKRHILLLNYLFTQGFKMPIATAVPTMPYHPDKISTQYNPYVDATAQEPSFLKKISKYLHQ